MNGLIISQMTLEYFRDNFELVETWSDLESTINYRLPDEGDEGRWSVAK